MSYPITVIEGIDGETAAARGVDPFLGFHELFRAGQTVDERFHLVRGAFLEEEFEDNADRLFRRIALDTDIGDETRDQFVHVPLTRPALAAG